MNKYLDNKIINKKIKKLKKNPTLFISDMIEKRKSQILEHISIKVTGKNNFTIVAAVYNTAPYLNDFFNSIVNQTLNFEKHIKIICVDDGSVDESAEIIRKWVNKYPDNIEYYFKENGGQASARNLGLKFVKTKWVTFTDPDDYLNKDFFRLIDSQIIKSDQLEMIVSNIIIFSEKEKIIKNSHPLRYRFVKNKTFNIKEWGDFMNFSAASTIFNFSSILKYKLEFDSKIKPNFEDGKFIADFVLHSESGRVAFNNKSIYYYRKREDGSSTIDQSWKTKEKFNNVLRYGHLDMLKSYKIKYNSVPKFIQRTTLYDVAWYISYLINNDSRISHLSNAEKQKFWALISEIFEYIDESVILNFNLAGFWFMHKVAVLGLFKKTKPQKQIVYIENIDPEKKELLISYYTYKLNDTVIKINSEEVVPLFYKVVENTFAEKHFVYEVRMWIPYTEESKIIEIIIDNQRSRLSLFGKHYNLLKTSVILEKFEDRSKNKYANNGSWILMDRDSQADDNAEHFYRYIMKNNIKKDCYFALRKDSSDWGRLERDGFNLIDFGSIDFEKKLKSCDKIISSHLDKYINNYFGDEYGYSKKFIFLQHGVIHNNLSNWLNIKKNLHCVLTSTNDEFVSLALGSLYKLTNKEVILTGLPRHDFLLESNNTSNIILIMPTWRNNLVGNIVGGGNERSLNSNFMKTEYAKSWYNVLHDPKLNLLSSKFGYQIIFAPHANISPYLDFFNIPEYIQIWNKAESNLSIQKLFQKSKFMVTDYSSVAFEMAYLGKQVIYYQFDKKDFFSGDHLFQKGYFDFEQHGFGPVVENHEALISEIENILISRGEVSSKYLDRINNTFAYRDTNNCKRVYEHIVQMDEFVPHQVDKNILNQFILNSKKASNLSSLYSRFKILLENFGIEAFEKSYDIDLLVYLLRSSNEKDYLDIPEISIKSIFFENLLCDDYQQINFKGLDSFYKLIDLFNLNKNKEFKSCLGGSWSKLNEIDQKIVKFIDLFIDGTYSECFDYYQNHLSVEDFDLNIRMQLFGIQKIYFKLLVLMNKNSLINNFYSKQIKFFQEYPELIFDKQQPNSLAS